MITRKHSKLSRKEKLVKRISLKRLYINTAFIVVGVLTAGLGLKGFLIPNGFIDGGVTGISLLITTLTKIPLPVLIIVINIPFMLLGFSQIDKVFVFKTLAAIVGLAICLVIIRYPVVTSDKLLVAVFGGFFLGAGIGLAMRGGAVLDGTELLSIHLSRKTGISIGDIILLINILIFSVAAMLLTFETALYSILTYLSATKTIDFIVAGIEEYIGVTIVSTRSDELLKMITEKLNRGATIYNGKRGYGKRGDNSAIDILFTVVTRLEVARLKGEIEKIDKNAFVVMHSINDTKGGMIKKRPLHS